MLLKPLTALYPRRREVHHSGIRERDGNKCVVTGILNINKGPYPPGTEGSEGVLHASHILRRSIVQEHSRNNRIAGTIDIIKHYTKLPEDIIDDLAGIIDNPENGMLLDPTWHGEFDSYMWCLHPTVASHKYTVHWLRRVPLGMEAFTEVQFQDHSRITLKMVFRFQTLRSLRFILRLPMSCTSVVPQKS